MTSAGLRDGQNAAPAKQHDVRRIEKTLSATAATQNDVRRLEGAQHARLRNRFEFFNNKENYGYCSYFCAPFSRCAEVVCFHLILHILLSNIYRRVGYFVRIIEPYPHSTTPTVRGMVAYMVE